MNRGKFGLFIAACLVFGGCAKGKGQDTSAEAASATSAAAAGALDTPAGASPRLASKRTKVTCPELFKQMEESSKSLKLDAKTTPGSWGKVPPELRKLPPGAEHCGSVDILDQAVIASGLAGKELEAFYAPLFAGLGCQPFTCEDVTSGSSTQTRCNCHANGYFGSVNTDISVESYVVSVLQRGSSSAGAKK
jgi:hypothetical protein